MINYVLVFFALIYASYTDIKERIVNNWLILALALASAIYWIALSIIEKKIIYYPFLLSAIVLLITYLLWRLSFFSAGDAKLLSAIALAIPIQDFSVFGSVYDKFFIIELFLLAVVLNFPIGAFLLLRNSFKLFKTIFLKKFLSVLETALSFVALVFIIQFFKLPFYIILLIFALPLINKKIRLFLSIFLFCISLYFSQDYLYIYLKYIAFAIIFSLLIILMKLSKSKDFAIKKKVPELKEGDILYESIFLENGRIVKKPSIKEIIHKFKNKKSLNFQEIMKELKKEPFIKSRPAGLNKEEIKKIKELYDKGIVKDIYIKRSIAFIPSLFLSYVLLILFRGLL